MDSDQREEKRYALSIVIPMYNESRRIAASLARVFEYIESRPDALELVLVDDGSADGGAETAERMTAGRAYARLIRLERNRGKGAAVRAGALAARGARIVYMDADLSVPLEHVAALERALDGGLDVAVGSRHLPGGAVLKHQPLHRRVAGAVFRLLVRVLVTGRFSDTQCGFKAFTREAARELFPRVTIERFCFDVELLFLAQKLGLRVGEAPVRWFNEPDSTLTLRRDAPLMLADLFRIRWNYWKGRYDIKIKNK